MQKIPQPKAQSSLERSFLTRWEQITRDLDPVPPSPVFQCHFTLDRDWIYDFGWPSSLVALDIQGGGYIRGGHSREAGMRNDYQKQNAALILGWRPFLASTSMMDEDPEGFIAPIITLLNQPVLHYEAEYSMWVARIRNLTRQGDIINNNGITVERLRGSRFNITLGKGTYPIGSPKMKMREAQEECLELILHGVSPAATPKRYHNKDRQPLQLAVFGG